MKTPLYVKSFHMKPGKDNHLTVHGMVTNRADFPVPPARLNVSLNDLQDRLTGRASVALPEVPPYGTIPFEAAYRLRDVSFVTVQFRLEKIRDVDYSEFNFSVRSWHGEPRSGGSSPGRKQK